MTRTKSIIDNIGIIENFYVYYEINIIVNPFRKRTGVFPSYFTGREDELNELREIYESTRFGAVGHIIIYGLKVLEKLAF